MVAFVVRANLAPALAPVVRVAQGSTVSHRRVENGPARLRLVLGTLSVALFATATAQTVVLAILQDVDLIPHAVDRGPETPLTSIGQRWHGPSTLVIPSSLALNGHISGDLAQRDMRLPWCVFLPASRHPFDAFFVGAGLKLSIPELGQYKLGLGVGLVVEIAEELPRDLDIG